MDTINSLLPNGNNNPSPLFTSGFPQGGGFPTFPSPFDFSMLSVKDIANNYYNNNALPNTGPGITIYTEPDSDPVITLQEVIIDSNRYYADFKDLEIVLFASRDGTLLLEQYQRVMATPKQIVLFLEIDDSTNFTGSVMRLKIGSDVEKMKGLPFAEIAAFARSKKIDLNPKEIQEFVEGGIDATKGGILKFITRSVSFALRFSSFAFDGLATFFDEVIPTGLDELRIDETHWKGDSLLFIADGLVDTLKNAREKDYEKIADKTFAPLFKKLEQLTIAASNSTGLLTPFFPPLAHKTVTGAIDNVNLQIADVKKVIAENLPALAEMMLTSVKILNAMLCGFVNSLIDCVKGIFQFIGIIFKITVEVTDVPNNAVFYTDYISEIIENFVGVIVQFDYAAFFEQMIDAPLKLYNVFSNFIKNGITINIDLVTAAYYCGYIVGLIVQIIIELLLTGGTVTVAKLVEYFKTPFTAIAGLVKASFGAAKTAFQRMLNFLNYIVNKLKKPKQLVDDFITFVDELLNGVRKEAGVADDIIEGLTESDLDWMASRKIGNLGGRVLKASQIRKLRGILKKKGITLIIEGDPKIITRDFKPIDGFSQFSELISFMKRNGGVGSFHAETRQFVLVKEATEIVAFHEMAHVRHFEQLGETFFQISKYDKEKYVWDEILKERGRWTKKELDDALKYVNIYCKAYGKPKINL